jgi:ABC-type branched-subunit amino acid transport system substrate-binding protein
MPESNETLCIGVVAPFSSAERVVAGPLLSAVEETVAASGLPIRVVARDDGREPALAADAVAEIVAMAGCIGLVGPKNSGCALAAAPIAAAAGTPLMLPCATADELTVGDDYEGDGVVFRLCAPDRLTARAAIDLVGELGIDRLAVLADDTAYGQGLAAKVRAAATSTTSVRIELTDDARGAGAAFLAMGEVEQAALMGELRADGFAGELISAEGGPDAPIAKLAGPAAEGAWLLYPGVPVEGRSVYAAEAADGARILLATGRGGPPAIRSSSFDGETGRIRFTSSGEREGAVVSRYRVHNGVAHLIN